MEKNIINKIRENKKDYAIIATIEVAIAAVTFFSIL
jgi:hypothetical protein